MRALPLRSCSSKQPGNDGNYGKNKRCRDQRKWKMIDCEVLAGSLLRVRWRSACRFGNARGKNMRKQDLIRAVARETSKAESQITPIVSAVFEEIQKALADGDEVA